jgi:hypothetical protein
MIVAVFPPRLQSVFWILALTSYVFGAVSGIFGGERRRTEAISFIALGLFLWHFPNLWDQLESAW